MARKRYDGLRTTLGGGLTNSGTTITFGAALTYHGTQADAVPTLGANDHIPLGILDANGVVCEVVWLTAYTAGATTGTIVRGKEGSTGIAHATGDKVVCAATSRDVAFAGSRFDNPDDPLWGADLGYDLEFEDDTSSAPSGYSWTNQGTSTFAQRWGAGVIAPQISGGSDNFRLLTRSLSGFPSTWEATTKLEATSIGAPTNWWRAGLCLRDSTTGKFTAFGLTYSTSWGTGFSVSINDWNTATSFSGGEVWQTMQGGVKYFKIKKNASTYDFLFSRDGISWQTHVAAKSAFATYNEIGFHTHAPVAADFPFQWLRVR